MLEDPASRASSLTLAGRPSAHSCDQAIPPKLSWRETTQSRARRTAGQARRTNATSRRTSQWCQMPTARYADMLVSPLWSSTVPATYFNGQEPSSRCVARHHA